MRVNLGHLYESHAALERLKRTELPARLAFKVARNLRILETEIADIEKQRMVIVSKHGKRSEDDPGKWLVQPEDTAAFRAEIDELFAAEIEMSLTPLRFDDLPDGLSITPADALALSYLVVDGDE